MSYLSPARKAELTERLTRKKAYLSHLYTISENFDDVDSYSFDSGEGKQQTKFRSLGEVLEQISIIESQIDRYTRMLEGTGLVNINLQRR